MIRIYCDHCKAEIARRPSSTWYPVWGTAQGRPILQHACSDTCLHRLAPAQAPRATKENWDSLRALLGAHGQA